jgi:Ca2+-binding RTX toxin-like protein
MQLETLSDRIAPSATLTGGHLLVTVDGPEQVHTVSIDSVGGQTQLTEDGIATVFVGVTSATVIGDTNAVNVVQNNTALPATLIGGKKDDTLFGGSGVNVIDGGGGSDVVYALLGTNTITSVDNRSDLIFTNAGAVVTSDDADIVVRFFAAGRTPNSPFIGVEDGVLYLTPSANGSFTQIDEAGKDAVQVTYDLGDGLGMQVATFTGVEAISYFGGSGDDTFVNNTKIANAAYGSAGSDSLTGGVGQYSLLKGSGGDDTLVGRAKENDISGNGGADAITVLKGKSTLRTDDADTVTGAKKKSVGIGG